jgi:hypothetical protein
MSSRNVWLCTFACLGWKRTGTSVKTPLLYFHYHIYHWKRNHFRNSTSAMYHATNVRTQLCVREMLRHMVKSTTIYLRWEIILTTRKKTLEKGYVACAANMCPCTSVSGKCFIIIWFRSSHYWKLSFSSKLDHKFTTSVVRIYALRYILIWSLIW